MSKEMPIIVNLGNKDIKPNHWAEIFKALDNSNFHADTHFALKDLL